MRGEQGLMNDNRGVYMYSLENIWPQLSHAARQGIKGLSPITVIFWSLRIIRQGLAGQVRNMPAYKCEGQQRDGWITQIALGGKVDSGRYRQQYRTGTRVQDESTAMEASWYLAIIASTGAGLAEEQPANVAAWVLRAERKSCSRWVAVWCASLAYKLTPPYPLHGHTRCIIAHLF